ncbi:MAG TPA: isoaspartyl peptidase/L-asparaginase [Terriglobia bacterium]|nr:isoaspartyl peptidase/L-asparaginase [Terriglobia bacterium]
MRKPIAIAIHGGAGAIKRGGRHEAARRHELKALLAIARESLRDGGASLDVVVAAVRSLEDSGLFDAGKGSVYTADGRHELDAALMDGATLRAGSVAAIGHVRNPIELARRIMDHTPHVMLVGTGAEAFAREQGLEMVENHYFDSPERLEQLRRAQEENVYGTVGAVALDQHGNLAAATSTGGMTNKRPGRVGDSPIIGSGVWADNATCAVSATGHGEYIMRIVIAHEVSSMMRYGGMKLGRATAAAIRRLAAIGGSGGLIAIDRRGAIAMPFNTAGMYRGSATGDGRISISVFP